MGYTMLMGLMQVTGQTMDFYTKLCEFIKQVKSLTTAYPRLPWSQIKTDL